MFIWCICCVLFSSAGWNDACDQAGRFQATGDCTASQAEKGADKGPHSFEERDIGGDSPFFAGSGSGPTSSTTPPLELSAAETGTSLTFGKYVMAMPILQAMGQGNRTVLPPVRHSQGKLYSWHAERAMGRKVSRISRLGLALRGRDLFHRGRDQRVEKLRKDRRASPSKGPKERWDWNRRRRSHRSPRRFRPPRLRVSQLCRRLPQRHRRRRLLPWSRRY